MKNQQVRYESPIVPRNQIHQNLLDLNRIRLVGETEADAQAANVSIHDHTFIQVKCVAEDDVGGFSADTGKPGELVHRRWNFSTMELGDSR